MSAIPAATPTPTPWFYAESDGTIRWLPGPDRHLPPVVSDWNRSTMMGDYRGVIVCDLKPAVGTEAWPAVGRAFAMPEAEANARLIVTAVNAHAPLVEACRAAEAAFRRLRAWLGLIQPNSTPPSLPFASFIEAEDKARAALQKAGAAE